MRGTRSLRRQIILSFMSFAAAVSLLFALSSFLIAYVVEDTIFENTVAEERGRQQTHWQEHGRIAPTRNEWVRIHRGPNTFPADLRREVGRRGPRKEYTGDDGRHYHVSRFPLDDGNEAYVVAEVGTRLAVRPLRSDLLSLIGLIATLILVVAATLGYWMATRATAPLSRLVEKASTNTPGELPHISAADFPRNEIGSLAATLEAMLARTRAFIERETRFTRDASHELRTPIAVIKTSAELMESKDDLPTLLAKPLERIKTAATQMEQSVDLLLLLAREEVARSPSHEVQLLPLVENVVLAESLRLKAVCSNVTVSVPESCRVNLSERVVATIVGNLVANAFNHARGSQVSITVEGCYLVITDGGGGLPAEVLEAQSDDALHSDNFGGFGLGLSIVARLCRLYGIHFKLENCRGGGTVAHVRLLQR